LAKYKVLVVDDDEDILFIMTKRLKNAGHKVFVAKNGVEAIDEGKKHSPDIIIMDISMPEMDGIATIMKMKTIENLRDIPVIVCTSVRAEDDQVVAQQLGVADYIRKDQLSELPDKIGRVLGG